MKYLKNEEEAKDCVQQIFLKTITELYKYQVDYFKSWIYMVAKNHCLMKLRDRSGKSTMDLTEGIGGISEEEPDIKFQHLEKDRTLDLMGTALEELSIEQKQCVTLFYLEKKSYQAIAISTGFSILKVKSYIESKSKIILSFIISFCFSVLMRKITKKKGSIKNRSFELN